LRERMGNCAAEYAQGYRWEKIAVQIVSVYEDLVEKKDSNRSRI